MNSRISTNQETRLRASEVALRLKISRSLAYQLMQTGEILVVKINCLVRVRVADLEQFIQKSLSGSKNQSS